MREHVLVIIPTYNRVRWLLEAIDSVFAQDHPWVKLVIVDDGSTDSTREECERILRRCPGRVFYQYQENAGCASARNRGLARVSEETGFVAFLDSDDRFLPGKFTREIKLLEDHPTAGFVYSDSIIYDEKTGKEKLQRAAAAGRPWDFALEHFLTNEAKSGAVLYRSRVLKGRRFNEELRWNEDSDFLQRIAIEHQGIYSPAPSLWVRWHRESKSRDSAATYQAVLQSNLEVLRDYPQFYAMHKTRLDGRVVSVRKRLFEEWVLKRRWNDARPYIQTPFQKLVWVTHLSFLCRLRRWLGKIKRWIKPFFPASSLPRG